MRRQLFLVGAEGLAATKLRDCLDRHPQVSMPGVERPKFFHFDGAEPDFDEMAGRWGSAPLADSRSRYESERDNVALTFEHYQALWNADSTAGWHCDSTFSYFYDASVPGRIAARFPDARFIVLIRNPVDCVASSLCRKLSPTSGAFDQSRVYDELQQEPIFVDEFWWGRDFLFRRGRYAQSIVRLRRHFGDQNILMVLHEELLSNTESVLRDIAVFLSLGEADARLLVDRFDNSPESGDASNSESLLDGALISRIRELLAVDMRRTAVLLDRKLAKWHGGRVQPRLPVSRSGASAPGVVASSERAIGVVHALARSGSTLLARCLGSMHRLVLLGELHAQAPHRYNAFNPLTQARDWYGLIDDSDFPALEDYRFIDALKTIFERCQESDRHLVVREWNHWDFMIRRGAGRPRGFQTTPILRRAFQVREVALTRHPVDQWLSFERFPPLMGKFPVEIFIQGYLEFARSCIGMPCVKYESLCAKPVTVIEEVSAALGVPYDPRFLGNWMNNTRVTGDVGTGSRGSSLKTIEPLPSRSVDGLLLERFNRCPEYHEAIRLFGYEDIAP